MSNNQVEIMTDYFKIYLKMSFWRKMAKVVLVRGLFPTVKQNVLKALRYVIVRIATARAERQKQRNLHALHNPIMLDAQHDM